MLDIVKKIENLSLQENPLFLEAARLNASFFTWRLFTAGQVSAGKDRALFLATVSVTKKYNADTHRRYMQIVAVLFDVHHANPNCVFDEQKSAASVARKTGVLIEFLCKLEKRQKQIRKKWLSL